jgi:cytochrome bd-type quinol oxidase subunit 2
VQEVPIRLAALWIALMLTYLLGDVLRIFAGDFVPGQIGGVKASPAIWLAAAAILLIPIVMLVVSVSVDGQVTRWAHILAAIGLLAFNLVGLPTYPGLYDRFLIAAGLGINALTVWTAWSWETA